MMPSAVANAGDVKRSGHMMAAVKALPAVDPVRKALSDKYNAKQDDGNTLFGQAVVANDAETVVWLRLNADIKLNAVVMYGGKLVSYLHLAALHRETDMCEELCKSGIRFCRVDKQTPLDVAFANNNYPVIAFLGAKVAAKQARKYRTAPPNVENAASALMSCSVLTICPH